LGRGVTKPGWSVLAILACLATTSCGSEAGTPYPSADATDGVGDGLIDVPPAAETHSDAGPEEVTDVALDAALCQPNIADFPVRPPVDEPATLSFLHVDGTDLVDESGARVALRGVNFGSWLQMEAWIAGIGLMQPADLQAAMQQKADDAGLADLLADARKSNLVAFLSEIRSPWTLVAEWRAYMTEHATDAQRAAVEALWAWFDEQPWVFEEEGMWAWLTRRFGPAEANDLREAFAAAWITEADVAGVAALGLNVIRVPFWYRALETDAPAAVAFRPEGWRHLDDVVRWCRKHKVWVILDLHGAPGGQSAAAHAGLGDGGHLPDEPRCIERTARLWEALASYFRDEPHVAIYDLLNEPMAVRSEAAYRAIHDPLYRAIREVDDRHVVMAEDGYRSPTFLASPREMGWTNAMFSIHAYPTTEPSAAAYGQAMDAEIERLETDFDWATRFDCPVLLGEFNAMGGDPWAPAAMDAALALLNTRGVHWTAWTWKFGQPDSTWGVWHPKAPARIDVKDASADQIREAFAALGSANFEAYVPYAASLAERAKAPAAPLAPVPVR
jgi:aryl-phospho-beta-D-glucosidase BglC (GH1 family)